MKASELLAQLHEIVAVHGGEMRITVSVGAQEYSADSISQVVERSLPVRVVLSSTEESEELHEDGRSASL